MFHLFCFFLSTSGVVVHVDKRITLAAFKQNMEPYVGVASTQFKVFRVYANNQEFESVRLNETLSSFSDDNKVRIPSRIDLPILSMFEFE